MWGALRSCLWNMVGAPAAREGESVLAAEVGVGRMESDAKNERTRPRCPTVAGACAPIDRRDAPRGGRTPPSRRQRHCDRNRSACVASASAGAVGRTRRFIGDGPSPLDRAAVERLNSDISSAFAVSETRSRGAGLARLPAPPVHGMPTSRRNSRLRRALRPHTDGCAALADARSSRPPRARRRRGASAPPALRPRALPAPSAPQPLLHPSIACSSESCSVQCGLPRA